jgi:hypothetical protein
MVPDDLKNMIKGMKLAGSRLAEINKKINICKRPGKGKKGL